MGVVADIADRVVVMRQGEIVEEAPVEQLFAQPQHPYTQQLLAAVPHLGHRPESGRLLEDAPAAGGVEAAPQRPDSAASDNALELRNVVIEYPGRLGRATFRAVDDVSLTIPRGQILGLVGESGSGKSTVGRAVVGLLRARSGQVLVDGDDITRAPRRRLRQVRSRIGMVFQDPASSLNPRLPIGDCIAEPLRVQGAASSRTEIERRVDAPRQRRAAGIVAEPVSPRALGRAAAAGRHRSGNRSRPGSPRRR